MNIEIAKECTILSDEGKISFPTVVQRLSEGGIELYYADLLSSNKTFYAGNSTYKIDCSSPVKEEVGEDFNKEGVIKAIRDIQKNQIKYQTFIERIMDSGVVCYMVFIKGRKAIYFGRKGEQHIEDFMR
jgi:uncharacterized protein YbcV (DUF1398 family)